MPIEIGGGGSPDLAEQALVSHLSQGDTFFTSRIVLPNIEQTRRSLKDTEQLLVDIVHGFNNTLWTIAHGCINRSKAGRQNRKLFKKALMEAKEADESRINIETKLLALPQEPVQVFQAKLPDASVKRKTIFLGSNGTVGSTDGAW